MGKSPGKWMKSLIFGKKSSRSKNSKAKDEKKRDGKEVPVFLDQTGNTNLSLSISQSSEGKIEEENLESYNPQDEVTTPMPPDQATGIAETTTEHNAQNDSDRIRQEQAATDVQAALRGYLARRAFQTLKGIIRLQALIRGHLVRRQAVSTLHCMFQIVKFQAIVRGRKIRHSDISGEVQKRCTQVIYSVGINSSMQILKLSSNGFARKILASSPTPMPLHFQYDPNETNSVLSWLERWSTSHCWQLLPKPKAGNLSKLHKPPHTRRTSVTNVESIASEFDKPIRNLRKFSTNEPANVVEENPELVLERVKRNLRKVHNPVLESTFQTETETRKKNTLDHTQKMKTELLSESERTPEQIGASETKTVTTRETKKEDENIPEEDPMKKEKKKSRRRVSLPANQEFMENNEPPQIKRSSVPSYMATTESAKAKLRSQDRPETPVLSRRYSLSSFPNDKFSLSPRPIQTTGKLKNDRSLQLSRNGNVKVNQPEWRR